MGLGVPRHALELKIMLIFGTEVIAGSWSSAGHLALVPLLLLLCLAAFQQWLTILHPLGGNWDI